MKIVHNRFKDLLKLTEGNFHKLFPTEKECHQYLAYIRWEGYMQCPRIDCDGDMVWIFKDGITYKCRKCGRRYTATTGTIFEGSNIPLTDWFRLIKKMVDLPNGVASLALSKSLGFTQKSTWFMLMRLRYLMRNMDDGRLLNGIVQLDQGHFGGKDKFRHVDKKSRVIKEAHPDYEDKLIYQVMLEENGFIRFVRLPNTEAGSILSYTLANVDQRSLLYTDDAKSHHVLDDFYDREIVNHSAKQYMNGNCTTNSAEGIWSYAKRHNRTHIWISKKYRDLYMDEIAARFNMRQLTFQVKFDRVLRACPVRLKRKELNTNFLTVA